MNRTLSRLLVAAVALFGGAACSMEHSLNPIGPTSNSSPNTPAATTAQYVGTWSSAAGAAPADAGVDLKSCTDITWTITQQTQAEIAGTISATCMGGIAFSATGTGGLTGDTSFTVAVNGTGNGQGVTNCPISLSGTGTFDSNSLHVNYSGTSCMGPFTGTAALIKKQPAPPPDPTPTPEPTPDPPPPPPSPDPQPQPWESCGSLTGDKPSLVQCVHDYINPGASGTLAFEVTKRVAWLLRGEGAGLLIKNGGENTISWAGYSFSISRICYPDGHIYKVISDAGDGGANGATWSDNDFVDPSLYVPAIDPR